MYLDADQLELTEACKAALQQLREDPTPSRLEQFYDTFGKWAR